MEDLRNLYDWFQPDLVLISINQGEDHSAVQWAACLWKEAIKTFPFILNLSLILYSHFLNLFSFFALLGFYAHFRL